MEIGNTTDFYQTSRSVIKPVAVSTVSVKGIAVTYVTTLTFKTDLSARDYIFKRKDSDIGRARGETKRTITLKHASHGGAST